MKSITRQYAEFICGLTYDDLPESAVRTAKTCVLDSVGNMLYGRYSPMGEKALAFAHANPVHRSESGQVCVPGGDWLSIDNAIFVSEVTARCADLDDGHRHAMGHPGSVLIPAALMHAQLMGKNGKEILTAIVAGYEVYTRLGAAINPTSYRERGFESTGVTGAVACTATLGKLYALNEEQMANALGIAALFAGGTIEYQNDGSMGKVLSGVWAANTAFQTVLLAQNGFTGAVEALEGKKGFIQAFSNAPAPERATAGLGDEYRIGEIYFKMHACMRGLHAAIDALLCIREREGLTAEAVDHIEVYTTPFVGRLSKPHPTTPVGAQSSIEFALAVAMKYGHISSEETLVDAMNMPEIYDLAGCVSVVIDEKVERYVEKNPSHWGAVKVVVHTKDGRTSEQFDALPQGEAENPFTWSQLCDKFALLSKGTPYEQRCKTICSGIAQFDVLQAPASLFVIE